MPAPGPTLADLTTIARQAGEVLLECFSQHFQVDYKGVIDPVTEADRRSEELLLGYIHQHFPGDTIVAEESGETSGNADRVWYIDPLDGTVNFVHGIPIYSVSIAVAENGVFRLGVVYDPSRDECFSAEAGEGAWLKRQPIHPASTADLDHALLVTGFPYDIRTNPETNLDHYVHFALHSQGVRRLGSAALDLCYVACGRFDGYWELRLKPWDVAAGALIAREAGAVVTTLSGESNYMSEPLSVVVANPRLHPLMLREIRPSTSSPTT
jgi:myo-inositol-1(or 4)-monophosphatase